MQQGLFRFSIPLEEVQEHFEQFFPHSAIMLDNDNCLAACNSVFLESTGYSLHELKGKPLPHILGRELEDVLMSAHQGTTVSGGGLSKNVTIRDSRGSYLSSRFFAAQVEGLDGVRKTMVHMYDIKPKRDLSLLQQFAGTLMRDINLGVILFDTDFKLTDISEMACRLLGFNRYDVLNKPMDVIFESIPLDHRLVQKSILDGIMVRNHAVSWMNNQQRYELLIDSSLLRNGRGEVAGGYITFKDVTNLRSLEEQVQRSDRLAMIGQIAAGAAHEIRNPLTSIKGFMQIFKNTFIENGMLKEQQYADIMLTEIDRINELVSEFLLLSKRKDVNYQLVEVPSVLKDILPIIQGEALLHGVSVQYDSLFTLPQIIADRELLKQVFLNICKNGIEAMGEGGTLSIFERVELDDRKVHIEIHDTGPGIPHFVIDKIFDPFFTTKSSGTGLGLSVCQRIIHDLGGAIRVSSKGYGTTFTVSLPIP
jgi:two-component system, sporulation sensor kinase E